MPKRSRTLRNVAEPIAASVFFAPEAHEAYEALGFDGPGEEYEGIRQFDWPAYFVSRAAALGRANGDSVAAIFGVFRPDHVVHALDAGWTKTNPARMVVTHEDAATSALTRMLGDVPENQLVGATTVLNRGLEAADPAGKPLFAALMTLEPPGTPIGDLWRACDQYREHRGDCHVNAWASAGLDGAQACLMNDLRQGLGLKTYARTRGWTPNQLDRAEEGLRSRGLLDGDGLSEAGRELREQIESATDLQQLPIINAIGDQFDQLIDLLGGWRDAIVAMNGYPGPIHIKHAAETSGL